MDAAVVFSSSPYLADADLVVLRDDRGMSATSFPSGVVKLRYRPAR